MEKLEKPMPAERLKFYFRYGIVKARMYVCACTGLAGVCGMERKSGRAWYL